MHKNFPILEFAQVKEAMDYLRKNYTYWDDEAERLVGYSLDCRSLEYYLLCEIHSLLLSLPQIKTNAVY